MRRRKVVGEAYNTIIQIRHNYTNKKKRGDDRRIYYEKKKEKKRWTNNL